MSTAATSFDSALTACPPWCTGGHERDQLVPNPRLQGEWYALHGEGPVLIDSGEQDLPKETQGQLIVELQHWVNHVTPEQPWTVWLKKTDVFGEEVDLVLTARQALHLAEVLRSRADRILAEETNAGEVVR